MYVGRPYGEAGSRSAAFGSRTNGPCDTEVRDQRVPFAEQDVAGLDVAMDDALTVGVVKSLGHLGGDRHCLVDRELNLRFEPLPKGLALDVRHDVVEKAGRLAGVEQGQDVRMVQAGGDLDLAQEALRTEGGRQLRVKDLDRDLSLVLQMSSARNTVAIPPRPISDSTAYRSARALRRRSSRSGIQWLRAGARGTITIAPGRTSRTSGHCWKRSTGPRYVSNHASMSSAIVEFSR